MEKTFFLVEESPSEPSQLQRAFTWEKSGPLYPSQKRSRVLWLFRTALAHALIRDFKIQRRNGNENVV